MEHQPAAADPVTSRGIARLEKKQTCLMRVGLTSVQEFGISAMLPIILVVEDEYLLQADLEAGLADGGFASEIVFTGEDALKLFVATNRTYQALVTDVRLGRGIDGWELARRIREKAPTFPVIYVTGAPAEEWAANGVPKSIHISKPFAPAQLVTAVATLLNEGSSTAM